MATIASLIVDIAANTATLQRDVDTVNTKLDSVGMIAGKVGNMLAGAFSIGAVVAFAKEMVSFASDMEDMSAKTGIGVGQLQELAYAASGAGVSIDQIAGAVSQLGKRLVNGDDGAVNAVRALGLNVEELIAMNPADAFLAISDRVAGIENPMKASAVAMALFGRSGADLLPAMKEDLRGLMEQARDTGSVISDDLVKSSGALDDAMHRGIITTKAWAFEWGAWGIALAADITQISTLIDVFGDLQAIAGFAGEDGVIAKISGRKSDVEGHAIGVAAWVREIDKVGLTTLEVTRAEKALDDQLKKSTKTREDHTNAVEKAAQVHRDFINWIGEREIEAIKANQEATAEWVAAGIAQLGQNEFAIVSWGEEYQKQLDEAALASEKWAQDVAVSMMDVEHTMIASTMTLGELWNSLGDSMSERTQNLISVIGDALGPRFSNIAQGMVGAWKNGQSLMKGIGEIMRGDFTNLVGTIISGVELIKSAWGAIKGIFSREGEHANDTRDSFLEQFGGGGGLAALLTSLGAGDGGGSLYAALIGASNVSGVNAAKAAVEQFLHDHGVPGFAMGSGGFQNFGQGTLAMLHGEERVQTRGQAASEGGLSSRIAEGIDMLNESLARWTEETRRAMRDELAIAKGRG